MTTDASALAEQMATLTAAMREMSLAHSQAPPTANLAAKAPQPDSFAGDTGRSATEALDWCFSCNRICVTGSWNLFMMSEHGAWA